jgi:hypothetical protein
LDESFERLDGLLEEMKAREKRKTRATTLKVTMPTDTEIVLTRVFDAPRQMVFDAFRKPELLKRWFGPHGWSLVVCEVDYQVGGGFRFVLKGPGGKKVLRRLPGRIDRDLGIFRRDGQNHAHGHRHLSCARDSRRGRQIRHGARRRRKL